MRFGHESAYIIKDIIKTTSVTLPDAAHGPSVVLVSAVRTWEDVTTAEAQAVGGVGRVRRRRPVVAVATTIIHRAAADVAGIDKVVGISSY